MIKKNVKPGHLSVADLDDDQDLDLVVSAFSNHVCLMINDGGGTFSEIVNHQAGASIEATVIGDVDGDQDLDVLAVNNFERFVSVFENQSITDYTIIEPDSIELFRGNLTSDDLQSETLASDDVAATFSPGFTLNQNEAPVWIVVEATLVSTPNNLRLVVESQAGTQGIDAAYEAWNWQTSSYDVLAAEDETFNFDSVVCPETKKRGR